MSLIKKVADRYGVEPNLLVQAIKKTAFGSTEPTNEQLFQLFLIAEQYGLNPFTKEIYVIPTAGGVIPVVSVDGWAKIINSHPSFDGVEFSYAENMVEMPGAKPAPEWVEARIYRKDRSRPIVVREYLDEVYSQTKGPWKSHTKRMMRHKSFIQCARLAFGFSGIYDPDEAERVTEAVTDPSPLELKPVSITEPASEPATIPAALLRQIQHQASLKGVEIPEFSTADEAKGFLKNLMAAQ